MSSTLQAVRRVIDSFVLRICLDHIVEGVVKDWNYNFNKTYGHFK